MATNGKLKVDEELAVEALQAARDMLEHADGEVVMDFSAVQRIDARTVKALEDLANKADDRQVRVALCGVNVDAYKVLKLVQLAQRFTFVN
jgi:anti-anti-sigma regulatory factor